MPRKNVKTVGELHLMVCPVQAVRQLLIEQGRSLADIDAILETVRQAQIEYQRVRRVEYLTRRAQQVRRRGDIPRYDLVQALHQTRETLSADDWRRSLVRDGERQVLISRVDEAIRALRVKEDHSVG